MSPGRGNDPKTRRRDAQNTRSGVMGWDWIAEGELPGWRENGAHRYPDEP